MVSVRIMLYLFKHIDDFDCAQVTYQTDKPHLLCSYSSILIPYEQYHIKIYQLNTLYHGIQYF